MPNYRLSLESLIRQRKLRIIKDPRESLLIDEIIRLREENETLKLRAKPQRKKKETPDEGGSASD